MLDPRTQQVRLAQLLSGTDVAPLLPFPRTLPARNAPALCAGGGGRAWYSCSTAPLSVVSRYSLYMLW